eukprot:3921327-Prymnesium_polylepis.2
MSTATTFHWSQSASASRAHESSTRSSVMAASYQSPSPGHDFGVIRWHVTRSTMPLRAAWRATSLNIAM